MTHRDVIIAAAARHGLPLIGGGRYICQGGRPDVLLGRHSRRARQAASYIDRILKGASRADFPVQQPTKYSLIINLRTAKALGLTIPPAVLDIGDEVIE